MNTPCEHKYVLHRTNKCVCLYVCVWYTILLFSCRRRRRLSRWGDDDVVQRCQCSVSGGRTLLGAPIPSHLSTGSKKLRSSCRTCVHRRTYINMTDWMSRTSVQIAANAGWDAVNSCDVQLVNYGRFVIGICSVTYKDTHTHTHTHTTPYTHIYTHTHSLIPVRFRPG